MATAASRLLGMCAHQQKEKAQNTDCQWRRMARSDLTWKSEKPNSPLTCLQLCSIHCLRP